MSAEIHRLFPDGLKHAEAEKGRPRYDPPLRFVPTKVPSGDDTSDKTLKTVTVELSQKTTQKVPLYEFHGTETFLQLQKLHSYCLDQQGVRLKHAKLDKLDDEVLKKIDAIPEDTADVTQLEKLRKLELVQEGFSDKMDSLITRSFTLYQQLLSPTLRAEWDEVVQEHCFTSGWIQADATISIEHRGQDWDTLDECKRLHLLKFCKKDAAERHNLYINNNVKKPQRMTIETFWKRVKELDALAPMLPCLKDQPDCPAEIERANVSLTPVQMCNFLMRCISDAMEDEYNCMTDVMPTDPKKLVELLTKIETKLKEVKKETKPEDRSKSKGQHDDSRSKAKQAAKASRDTKGKIPRKNLPKKAEKQCGLCEEYGGASHSHHTSQCKKWVAGGQHHPEWRGPKGGKTANINVHQDIGVKQLMAQQLESQKSMMKMMSRFADKKKKSKKRKSSKYYSDSDSSDSD